MPPPAPPPTTQAMKFHVFIRTTPMNIVVENLYLLGVSSDVVAKDFNFVAFVTLRHISSTSFLFF